MPQNAARQSGNTDLKFEGTNAYVEVACIADCGVITKEALTVSAWMRPNTPDFPRIEPKSDSIYGLSTGDASGREGTQEWTFRIYNHVDRFDTPPKRNRIGFHLYDPQGGFDVSSCVRVPVAPGQWLHLVGVVDSAHTYLYRNGQFIRCDPYHGPAQSVREIHCQPHPNQSPQLMINPQVGATPNGGPKISAPFSNSVLPGSDSGTGY